MLTESRLIRAGRGVQENAAGPRKTRSNDTTAGDRAEAERFRRGWGRNSCLAPARGAEDANLRGSFLDGWPLLLLYLSVYLLSYLLFTPWLSLLLFWFPFYCCRCVVFIPIVPLIVAASFLLFGVFSNTSVFILIFDLLVLPSFSYFSYTIQFFNCPVFLRPIYFNFHFFAMIYVILIRIIVLILILIILILVIVSFSCYQILSLFISVLLFYTYIVAVITVLIISRLIITVLIHT